MEKNEIEIWTDEQGAVFSADKKKLLHCPDVEEYVIPDHVEEISPYAFDTSPRLRTIDFNRVLEIPERRETEYGERSEFHGSSWTGDYEITTHHYIFSIFEKCPLVEDIKLSTRMDRIGRFAFAGLKHMKSFTIPFEKHPVVPWHFSLHALRGNDQIKELTLYEDISWNYYEDDKNRDIYYHFKTDRHILNDLSFPALETCRIKLVEGEIGDFVRVVNECANFKNIKTIILPADVLKQIEIKNSLPTKDSIEYIGE